MKKLIICLQWLICLFCISENLYAQSATIEASASGIDQENITATISILEITGTGIPTALNITTTSSSAGCFSDYTYNLLVNEVVVFGGFCNVNNLNLAFFVSDFSTVETVGLQAVDVASQGNPDPVDVNFSLAIEWVDDTFETDITAFDITGATSSAVIDQLNHTIDINIPFDTGEALLVPDFSLSLGASVTVNGVNQESGVSAVDFNTAVIYTVNASDGSTTDWTVNVHTSPGISSANNVSNFSINGVSGIFNGTTITLDLGTFASLSDLVPIFTLSEGAVAIANSEMQLSGVSSLDFWEDVNYTIYAADGSINTYTVSVSNGNACGETVDFPLGNGVYNYAIDQSWSIQPDGVLDIVSVDIFSFQIDTEDSFEIYEGKDAGGTLIASSESDDIIGTYASLIGFYIHFVAQESSVGQGVEFNVSCEGYNHDFTSFSFVDHEAEFTIIDTANQTITIELEYGAVLANLVANFELSPLATANIEGITQTSGEIVHDYSAPIVYTVVDGTGVEYNWTINVSVRVPLVYFVTEGGSGSQDGSSEENAAPNIGAIIENLTFIKDSVIVLGGVINEPETLNHTDGVILVKDGATINMGVHDIINNGHITLESGAAFVQGVGSINSGSGSYEVIRTAAQTKFQFRFLSSPIDNINIQSVYGGSNVASPTPLDFDIYEGWIYHTTGTLENGKGYAVNGSNLPGGENGERRYIGNINNGDILYLVDGSIHDNEFSGWNLLGNPYPSAISISSFISSSSIVGFVTLYNPITTSYISYNLANASDNLIPSGVGFYTHAAGEDVTSSYYFNSHRLLEAGQISKNASIPLATLGISDQHEDSYNTCIAFTENASDGFDKKYDALLIPKANDITVYSILESYPYAIQSFKPLQKDKVIYIGIEGSSGNYTIEMSEFKNFSNDVKVLLVDKTLGTTCNLLHRPYSFYKEIDEKNDDRFELRFEKTDPIKNQILDDITVNTVRNTITITASETRYIELIKLYDLNGKLVAQWNHVDVSNQQQNLTNKSLSGGNYILEMISGGKFRSEKISLTQ